MKTMTKVVKHSVVKVTGDIVAKFRYLSENGIGLVPCGIYDVLSGTHENGDMFFDLVPHIGGRVYRICRVFDMSALDGNSERIN